MNEALISEFARNEACRETADAAPLRPVLWSELTARLAAMRDLRHSLSGAPLGRRANFSSLAMDGHQAGSAFTDFADLREGPEQGDTKVNVGVPDINLKALADGKGPAPNSAVELNCVTPGDRELK
jgi:hypothetical protein